jgi:serine-type D-Ala-D-Ala carboxypeptidase/endopeptidase (penicillin-binding protein 4)
MRRVTDSGGNFVDLYADQSGRDVGFGLMHLNKWRPVSALYSTDAVPSALLVILKLGASRRVFAAMRLFLLGILMWFSMPASALAGERNASLPPAIEAALQQAKVPNGAVTAVVQELGGSTPRLSWQAHQAMNPASVMKLLTTTAALELLGPAWMWATPVWLQGLVNRGVLEGDLIIQGRGDPKLVVERMWLLLRRVQQLGVTEIRGDIVLDRSAFKTSDEQPPDFDGEALRPYNVQPDALLLNYKSIVLTFTPDPVLGVARVSSEPPLGGVKVDSTVPLANGTCGDDWRVALKADFSVSTRVRFGGTYPRSCSERVWPVAYADPKTYNERALSGLWREMGGKLTGRVREGLAPASTPTFEMSSPSLAEMVRDINKYSNNVMAQQLFLTLGLEKRGSGSMEAARDVMRQWLQGRHGEFASGAVMSTGSGLSLDSRLTAHLLAQVLQTTWASPVMPELMSSLPVIGVDGTLRRARNAPAGRAHLKTGSMPKSGISCMAGYVLGDSGRRYVLVVMVNHPNAMAARPAMEALVRWTAADVETDAVGQAASKDARLK